jgi:hypothetical protein
MNKNPSPKTRWKKGQSGNPKGMPPLLIPHLRKAIEDDKNAFKNLLRHYLSLSEENIQIRQRDPTIPFIEKILGQVLERISNDGDVFRMKALIEILFGKLPEEKEEYELSGEEKIMIDTYRKRCEDARIDVSNSSAGTAGNH